MLFSQTEKFQPFRLQNVLERKMKYSVNFIYHYTLVHIVLLLLFLLNTATSVVVIILNKKKNPHRFRKYMAAIDATIVVHVTKFEPC